jgi:hypothetical protein
MMNDEFLKKPGNGRRLPNHKFYANDTNPSCTIAKLFLRTLRTVFRTALFAVVYTSSIQCATYNGVTYTRKIFYTTTPYKYD